MKRVALITGGQRGIGLAVAHSLAEAGFSVALASEVDAGDETVADVLRSLGPSARYYRHDLREISGVAALLDRVEGDFGPVTTLVSNAGVSARQRADMLELDPESFDFVMDINLKGAFFLAQNVAKHMLERSSPHYRSLTFITSVSAAMVSIERAEYCLSKAASSMMAELFAVRLAPHGIGVFELRPGIIETDMTAGVKDKYTARIEAGLVPAGRWGQPQDIGSIVVPIAEGRMAFASGAAIPVDGGLSIPRL